MDLFNKTMINDLGFALKVSSVKNDIISSNVANVDTPGYKSKKLEFKEVMTEYYGEGKKLPMTVTHPMHFTGKPNILVPQSFAREQNNPSLRNDGNDVNLDYEMSEMAKNGIQYSMFSQIIAGRFTGLKSAITGR
jgi:flagellar basal-body rod protein FlgB